MRSATPDLKALLAYTSVFFMADLYTILLRGTQPLPILRYTNVDVDITWLGVHKAGELKINRSGLSWTTGMQVDSLELEVYPGATALINGIPWLQAVKNGALDAAEVELDRLFLRDWTNPVDAIRIFSGRVSDVMELTRSYARIKVASLIELLNAQWPVYTYQAGCSWYLYNTGCGLTQSALTQSGTVAAGGTDTLTFNTNLTEVDHYFELGAITFTSGSNGGLTRTIDSHLNAGGALTVSLGLPAIPAPGDTFTLYPGCDRRLTTCETKFANSSNFRGCPYIPVPETAI